MPHSHLLRFPLSLLKSHEMALEPGFLTSSITGLELKSFSNSDCEQLELFSMLQGLSRKQKPPLLALVLSRCQGLGGHRPKPLRRGRCPWLSPVEPLRASLSPCFQITLTLPCSGGQSNL